MTTFGAGNVPTGTDEKNLRSFLALVCVQVGLFANSGDPFVSLRISGHCAFLEVRSAREATGLLRIAGVPYRGTRLRIGRPTKCQDAPLAKRDEDSIGLIWPNTLDEHRTCMSQFGSPDPELCGKTPLPPLSSGVVTRLATLTDAPSNVLVLRGALRAARAPPVSFLWSIPIFAGEKMTCSYAKMCQPFVSPLTPRSMCRLEQGGAVSRLGAGTTDPYVALNDILKDLHTEASKYGAVLGVALHDTDNLKVAFSLIDDAILAIANFKFMRFYDQAIDVHFQIQAVTQQP